MIKDKKNSAEYEKILKLLDASGQITAGVHAEEGACSYPDDGPTVIEIAEAAEFGLDQPQRSWLRQWFDEHKTEIEAILQQEYVRSAERREPMSKAADRVAQWMAASIQRRIRNRIPPPNHPITIGKKGSSTPLIDTGLFRSSIMGRVRRLGAA